MGIDRDTLAQLRHLVRPLATRVANSVARAVVQLADDAKKLQSLQIGVLEDEDIDEAEHHQSYGFSSVPLEGAEAVVVFPNGDRGHPLVVAVSDRRYRPTGGQPGEVTVYNSTGAKVTITKDGDIVAVPAAGREVRLGSGSASDPPALASELEAIKTAIDTWVPVPNDGGASLKAVFSAWSTPGAGKVKVE